MRVLSPSSSFFLSVTLFLLLAACGTPRPAAPTAAPAPLPAPPPPTPAAGPAPPPAPPRVNLASEQVRLSELFRGTPVVFAMQQDGSLRATVPRRFSFDAGATQVKPPLAAVLDRLAKSQLQTTTRLRVSAPADPPVGSKKPAATLARDRAAALRDHLAAQGIAAARVETGSVVQVEQVEIVVSDAAR